MNRATDQQLSRVLKGVSRSFHPTLKVLPRAIRPAIGLAYLLARTTDTIADTELVPVQHRLGALKAFRERILGGNQPLKFGELLSHQSSAAERMLLEQAETTLSYLGELEASDLQRVRRVLEIISSGQELDLQRFAEASPEHIVALKGEQDLDDYTWRVAGCVGEFWTRMCRAHLFPTAPLDESALLAEGVRFGKGLQLVNILRDLPADLRQGRCYLPSEALTPTGLAPGDLLEPATEPRLRPVYNRFLETAQAHLHAGWDYTNRLPRGCARVRLACAWPILIGLQTLDLLSKNNVLEPSRRLKVSKSQVRKIFARSVLAMAWPPAWKRLVQPRPEMRI